MLAMALTILTACTSDNDEPKTSYNFLGSYIGYTDNQPDDLTSLVIRDNNTFTHTNADSDYQEKWEGEWTYDEKTNIITLHYLTEEFTYNGKTETNKLEDDYCWAQPYDNGNKLRYKEYWDDEWEQYSGFIKTSYKY